MPLVSFSSIISPYEISEDAIIYTASIDNKPIGYITARIEKANRILPFLPKKDILFIDALEISKAFRKNGLGSLLYHKIRNEYKNYDIVLMATRFSLNFWKNIDKSQTLHIYSKCEYLLFEKIALIA